MSFQEELYYKIEAYLSGELDAGEVTAFENLISTDNLLKAQVEKHKVANALIMEQRFLSVKNILQEERIKDSNSGSSFKPVGFILLAVAAIGIGTSVWMLNKDNVTPSSTKGSAGNDQIVSTTTAPINKNTAVNNKPALKQTSPPITGALDNSFHKDQNEEVQENARADNKTIVYVNSTSNKSLESITIPSKVIAPTIKSNVPVNPCSNIFIQATVKAIPTCSHEVTGTILVNNILGGTKPYIVEITNSHKESVVNGALEAGTYHVSIIDANTCEKMYSSVQITEKECPIDYSFNPFIGEKWAIESYKAAGQLEIYNKGGVLQYQEHLDANSSNEWTGVGLNSQILPGYYIFVINYADGTTQKGSVTIVQ